MSLMAARTIWLIFSLDTGGWTCVSEFSSSWNSSATASLLVPPLLEAMFSLLFVALDKRGLEL